MTERATASKTAKVVALPDELRTLIGYAVTMRGSDKSSTFSRNMVVRSQVQMSFVVTHLFLYYIDMYIHSVACV